MNRTFPFLFLILPVIFLLGAYLPTQIVVLNPSALPENLLSIAKEKVPGSLTEEPSMKLKGEIIYKNAPFYGILPLAGSPENRFVFALDGSLLYVDSDRDGNLAGETPLTARPVQAGLYRKTLLFFPVARLRLNYPGAAFQDYFVAITCDLENRTFSFENVGYRTGTVLFPFGKDFKVAIYDANPPNGTFDDYQKDMLLVDLNNDGEFDVIENSPELTFLTKTMNLAGTIYAVEVPPSGEYVNIRQFSGDLKPSGQVTVQYRTEYNNTDEIKIQKETREALFDASGRFRVSFPRGPTAFRRGSASVEIKFEEGNLILYDGFDRLWTANFVGSSLSPVAVVTRFPAEVAFGFPFKMNVIPDKKDKYTPGERAVIAAALQGQAGETYTRFLVEEVPRWPQPAGTDLSKKIFREIIPHIVITAQDGSVVTESDMLPFPNKFVWPVPSKEFIPSGGAVYTATVTWDTGPFQGVVSGKVFLPVIP